MKELFEYRVVVNPEKEDGDHRHVANGEIFSSSPEQVRTTALLTHATELVNGEEDRVQVLVRRFRG